MSLGSNFAQPLTCIVPRHLPTDINSPFPLLTGPIEVTQGNQSVTGTVDIEWAWFPIPEIRFKLDVPVGSAFQLGPCTVTFPLRNTSVQAMIIGTNLTASAAGAARQIRVFFDRPVIFGGQLPHTRVQVEVVGFHEYHGLVIADPIAATAQAPANNRAGRVVLTGGGWKITLDSVSNLTNVVKALNMEGGFALTHTATIEREDGGSFTTEAYHEIEDALFDFLSFARGSWSAPVLPTETDGHGNLQFEIWAVHRLAPWKFKDSWFNTLHAAELPALFPGFMTRWIDPQWRDAVRFAIHSLVEANSEPISMEASLILAQVAFELLSAAILVEDLQIVTAANFNNKGMYPAFRKFQELLQECSIPAAIPGHLGHLSAVAATNTWADGPTALTQTRNKLAHASLPNLKKLFAITAPVKSDLKTLAIWYVELVLLWWFGYSGGYRSRVDPTVPQYAESKAPWAP